MALNASVKVGPEFYVYTSKTGGVYVDPATELATESATITDPTTVSTQSASGTGNTLAVATYYSKYTWVDACGETLPPAASTGQAVTSGQKLVITIPAKPTGAAYANIYIGTAAGAVYLQGTTSTTTYEQTTPISTTTATPPAANTTGPSPTWGLVAFSRLPISYSEPRTLIDIYDHFKIHHIKKGRQQRKTLSIRKAYTNYGESFRQLGDSIFLVKIEVHPDDAVASDENIYFTGVRVLTPSNEVPDEEATESIECSYTTIGFKDV